VIIDQGQGKPPYLDVRFDSAANAIRCSGNTIIAHLRGAQQEAVAEVQEKLANGPGGTCFAWLPTSSLHMTIYDLMLHDRRGDGNWPAELPIDATNFDADEFALGRLNGFRTGVDGPIRMNIASLDVGESGASLTLEPAGPEQANLVRELRDKFAARVGLSNRPGHATYVFHVTLAYLIDWLPADLQSHFEEHRQACESSLTDKLPALELWPPEVCLFDDMCEFRTQFTVV